MTHAISVAVKAVVVVVAATLGSIALPAIGHATDTCVDSGTGTSLPLESPPCSDVLAQEARWFGRDHGG